MAAKLFEPIDLRSLRLPNRIVVAPMTQFSANEGVAGDWHFMHLGQYAVSGVALVLTESTYVAAGARNARSCLSLYSDEQEAAIGRIAQFYADHSDGFFGVQLCHAGRKASAREPWKGGGPLPLDEGGYEAVAPSAVPLSDAWPAPTPLSADAVGDVIQCFVDGARRAERAGAKVIELHGAHGYLIHQFLSPLTNRRNDEYGGSSANRMRFAIEVFDAVRAVWPDDLPIGIRVSATDWVEGGWSVEETVELARTLDARGCDYIHVSSGGLSPAQQITVGPGYQVGFAEAVKEAVSMPVIAVGQILDAHQAEAILNNGQADMIALARPILHNPRWAWHAAHELGEPVAYPRQYERGHPDKWGASGINAPGNRIPGK
ncbi:MAG: NADH:flavin oxidoreductase/NADH oxidase [Rhodospirillaceae bacterium]|jgi:2,4-dienoyl-CoA reductase-like NADH-dependent reductase (Old Yellow Enzyme family)|nr:NADH:flavin oxidoreductase/NADH oxidase [Rhodospirillaceae bacterium]MBT5458150.1 NADH:flavin oxidoreductase/NADH oxidase [Rhodospirillaceae bacterium]